MNLYILCNSAVAEHLGSRLRELRMELNMTQAELSTASGVGLSTIKPSEKGGQISIGKLIQILRSLRRFDMLDPSFAPKPVSPIELEKAQKDFRPRKRVRK